MTMCNIHIHILSTHSVLLDILTVINTHYTPYVHILHYVHIYTHTVICTGAVDYTVHKIIHNSPHHPPYRHYTISTETLPGTWATGGTSKERNWDDERAGGDWAVNEWVVQSGSHSPKEGWIPTCLHRLSQTQCPVPVRRLPMPWVDDLLERIGRAKYITTLDLCKGYWQVPLEPTSRPYTAFRTPIGLYQFTVHPFGLHGAPATFQRLMDRVLQGCEEWCAAYLDDVVIHSNSWQEHLQHLRQTLEKITKAGLMLNVGKNEWARQEANYLGYHLGNRQLCPQVNKVEAICQSPRPKTKKEVRSFLGLVGWYKRFVLNFASIAAPLTNLLNKGVANPILWTEDCEAAFKTLKEKMCSSPVLQSPDFTESFLVQVDASAKGLGMVLVQGTQGNEKPVVYLSRKLLPRETRYSAVEKECLAIKWALESLRYYLLGREFSRETDHRALIWLHSMKDHNARVMRWYLSLQPFNFKVRHRPGRLNIVADYLSRFLAGTRLEEGGGNETKRLFVTAEGAALARLTHSCLLTKSARVLQ